MQLDLRRREFMALVGGAAAAWPLAARTQQADRVRRVGVLGPARTIRFSGPGYQIFVSELRKLGFTEGQNVVVDYRRTDEGLLKAFTGAATAAGRIESLVHATAQAHRRSGDRTSPAHDVQVPSLRRGGRAHVLWRGRRPLVAARRLLRREDSARSAASRAASGANREFRVCR